MEIVDDHRDQSSSAALSETWNGLPDVAIKKIFGKFKVEDRARMKLVSKLWNQIVNRVDIPTAHELPWLITSDDSFSKPDIFLTHISIGTLDNLLENGDANYQFKLPKFYEHDDVPTTGCLCGTSNGWLVIATGSNLKPDMFLWNPLSGKIRNLPPLSTLPFVTPILDDLPSFVKRVEIFSNEEFYDCIVAVVFSHPTATDDKEDCLALCTPHENGWSILTKGNCHSSYRYRDILHHNGTLYALAQNIDDGADEAQKIIKANHAICLSSRSNNCEVKICVLRLKYKLNAQRWTRYNDDQGLISRSFNISYANEFNEHLVECSTSGKLMVVAAVFDLYEYNSNDGPVESFRCHKTSALEVRTVEADLQRVTSLGEQSFFIASTGSISIPSSAQGLIPNCIFFTTDDARGLVGDNQQYSVVARELGNVNMQHDVSRSNSQYLRFPVHSKTGWFKPKLF